jgi:hypothetical protein
MSVFIDSRIRCVYNHLNIIRGIDAMVKNFRDVYNEKQKILEDQKNAAKVAENLRIKSLIDDFITNVDTQLDLYEKDGVDVWDSKSEVQDVTGHRIKAKCLSLPGYTFEMEQHAAYNMIQNLKSRYAADLRQRNAAIVDRRNKDNYEIYLQMVL